MDDSMDSDTCVGFKRDHSEESNDTVSFPKEELEPVQISPKKKVKCSFDSNAEKDQQLIDSGVENVSLSKLGSGFCEKTENVEEEMRKRETIDNSWLLSDSGPGGKESSNVEEKMVKDSSDAELGFDTVTEKKLEMIDAVAQDVLLSELGNGNSEKIENFDCHGVQGFDRSNRELLEQNEGEKEENLIGEEIESESILEAEKRRLLVELEVGAIFKDKTHVDKITGFSSSRFDKNGNDSQELNKPVESVGLNKDNLYATNAFVGGSVKIEVIDDTALIDMLPVRKNGNNGFQNKQEVALSGKNIARSRDNNVEKPSSGKQPKRSRRKGKEKEKAARTVEGNKNLTRVSDFHNIVGKNGNQSKIMYSRLELEAMRFVKIAEQRNLWRDIYSGFAPEVANEYNNLGSWKNLKNSGSNSDHRQPRMRRNYANSILGDDLGNEIDCMENNEVDDVEEYVEEDESEDDGYNSILKPAFAVEGEPDFDSGPPEDGLEYLRRVRWEADQIPNVRVAKIDKSKHAKKEQSVYMPQIPEIAKCPEHLLPLKQWEDALLSDFSNLRLALSRLDASMTENFSGSSPFLVANEDDISDQLPEDFLVEKLNSLTTEEIDTHLLQDFSTQESSNDQPGSGNGEIPHLDTNPKPKTSVFNSFAEYPTLSDIRGMDYVTRVSMLRKRISSVEAASSLSRSDCLWLFSLCAAVDTPLDAGTCASLRGLLRKCADIRAAKSEVDDEVIMANILATISGRYFGQMES